MGVKLEIESDQTRLRPDLSEVERLWASHDKATKLLGWKPQHAGRDGFRRGLEKTIAWFSEPGRLALYKPDLYNL